MAIEKLEAQISEPVNLNFLLQKTRNCLATGKAVKLAQGQAAALRWATKVKGNFAQNLREYNSDNLTD